MNFFRLTNVLGFIACFSFQLFVSCSYTASANKEVQTDSSGVAVLLVDTDHPISTIDENIYGQFLEHINHSVEDGLYAEQVQGQGFEGKDFQTYWKPVEKNGKVTHTDINFQTGVKSVRLSPTNGTAGIQQQRLFVKKMWRTMAHYG
jgi:alpha-N-arabinofuranosidase